ncbi:MAG: mechanosensitive ion channel family protein [Armatimonadetes bacterium]|nr:mechanosensitive ion channel family protein [Armatimonadota bacterium]
MAIRRLSSVLSLLALACACALGQIPGIGGKSEQPTGPPGHLANARVTMETFLKAMNAGDDSLARETMDLGAIPAVIRATEGNRLGTAMWDAMNRTEWIVVLDIPDDAEGGPYVWHSYGDAGSIVIAMQSDGAWRFTAATVASIDAIRASVADQKVVEGLTEVQLLQADPALWLKQKYPASWQDGTFLRVPLWQFASTLILLLAAFAAGFLIRLLTSLLVRSSLHIDEEIASKKKISALGRSLGLLVNVALVGSGLPYLDLPFFVTSPVLFVLKVLTAVAWLWLLSTAWDVVVALVASKAGKKSKSAKNVIVPIASKFGRFFIFIGVLVFFISQLGYDVTALLAGLGIGGLVFALAAKDSIENLFGSITILTEMPFGVGDWVKIGDISGDVEEINLRSTRIRTFQDSLVTLPNSRMISSHVENFGMRRRRRIKTILGLSYDTPPAKLAEFCERVRQMLFDDEHIWNDKRYVYFNHFGDSTLNIMLYCFVIAETWQLELEYRDAVLRKVMEIAQEMGVEFAYPTRTLIIPGGSDDLRKLPAV